MLWTLQVYLLQNIYLESTLQEKFCVDINQYECVHQSSNLHQGIQTTESLPKHKCSREQIASNKLLQRKQWERSPLLLLGSRWGEKRRKKRKQKIIMSVIRAKFSSERNLISILLPGQEGEGMGRDRRDLRGSNPQMGTLLRMHNCLQTTLQLQARMNGITSISAMIRWQSSAKEKRIRNQFEGSVQLSKNNSSDLSMPKVWSDNVYKFISRSLDMFREFWYLFYLQWVNLCSTEQWCLPHCCLLVSAELCGLCSELLSPLSATEEQNITSAF